MGAPPEVIAACQLQDIDSGCEVWEENKSSIEAFLSLSTCWDIVSNGVGVFYAGLPATEIHATLQLFGFSRSKRKRIFLDLREMERAALVILNE